jgi:3-methyladenine DNA glycosylase AlkC
MDYTISNNARLLDEPVIEVLDDLKAAKVNYVQRSIDHIMNCLVLAI